MLALDSLLEEIETRWISAHLYYHEGLDRVIRDFVQPVVLDLIEDEIIDRFFFIRYGLGGPHVRLRVRTNVGRKNHAVAILEGSAKRFLSRQASEAALSSETIQLWNRSILASDPNETDDTIYPDNSLHFIPLRPEIDRYGSADLYRLSLDFFTLSSAAAIIHLSRHGEQPRSQRLARAFGFMLRQAQGMCLDTAELTELLGYGLAWWGSSMPRIIQKAKRVARSQEKLFLEHFRESLTPKKTAGCESSADILASGARSFSAALGDDRDQRARVMTSQMHMTASRLGLSNAEEVYLSYLLTATLRSARNGDRPQFELPLGHLPCARSAAVSDLIPPVLSSLASQLG